MDAASAQEIDAESQFEAWLAGHGGEEREVWLVIHKKASGKQTVTFDQLLDVALCHGWVDVQTKSVDDERYAIRFTPRRQNSSWSATNRARVRRLLRDGRMTPAGLARLPHDLGADVGT
jgi:uncharacterized protein YdeI (YjbR/CyaY-like superfamily)